MSWLNVEDMVIAYPQDPFSPLPYSLPMEPLVCSKSTFPVLPCPLGEVNTALASDPNESKPVLVNPTLTARDWESVLDSKMKRESARELLGEIHLLLKLDPWKRRYCLFPSVSRPR